MDTTITDDNTKDEASSATPETDVTKADSSTAVKGTPPKTLDDVANAFMAQGEAEPAEPVEGADDTAPKEDEAKASVVDGKEEIVDDETKPLGEELKVAEIKKEVDESLTDATKPPPFNEHPRWKEVLAERDALRPLADAQRKLQEYCTQYDIPTAEVDTMFEIAALMRTDPKKAYERLTPIVQAMEQHLGISLPADLEANVSTGKMTPEHAAEVAKLRAEAKQSRSQLEQVQKRTQQQNVQQMTRSVQEWIGNKQKTDLGFKPKVNGSDDGLYEFVDALYAQAVSGKPPTTASEAVAYAEQAYSRAKKVFSTRTANTVPAKKTLSSTKSSVAPTKKPRTLDEVAMQFVGSTWETRRQ